jgi:Trypsin-like peptidase domain
VAIVSFAVGASPLMKSRSPADPIAARISPLRHALIYAKEGSPKLVDGRWNLGQSEAKLGIELSDDEAKQLMACTGQIVCETPGVHNEDEDRIGVKVTATAVSVLKPDLLVTARHVLFEGKRAAVSFDRCSFRSYSQRKIRIPVVVEKDQRKGFVLNNEDFVVVRLKRELAGCNAFATDKSASSLREGEPILSVTGQQLHSLNKVSNREPVVATGRIRRVLEGVLGGPPFYYADVDLDEGGSGGAVFALAERSQQSPNAGRPVLSPVSDDEGRLILRGISVAYGPRAKSGKPYSDERNYTIVIGLEADFRELVEGKAERAAAVEPASCPQGGAAKIDVISTTVPPAEPETLAPLLQQKACGRDAKPGRKKAKPNADCARRAKGLQLASSQRVKEKHEFTLKNATTCRICFTYNRCNAYGCWDQAARLSAKSSLFAGVGERPSAIKNPQFCK